MDPNDEVLLLWARIHVRVLLLRIARALREDAREMQKTAGEALAASLRLEAKK